jgi:hypothetical protein
VTITRDIVVSFSTTSRIQRAVQRAFSRRARADVRAGSHETTQDCVFSTGVLDREHTNAAEEINKPYPFLEDVKRRST